MDNSRKEHINLSDLSKEGFDQLSAMEKVDLFSQSYRVPRKQSKEQLLKSIQEKIDHTVVERPVRKLKVYWTAAASIALIVLLSISYNYWLPGKMQVVAVANGEHREFVLPDGSEMQINADTRVTFSESKFKGKRELKLEGEAYFSVQKGSPFVVKTPIGVVEVLGTTLNVFSRDNNFHVACFTGKVSVKVGAQSVTILPGEKVVWLDNQLIKSKLNPDQNTAGWVNGQFSFDNIPLISIFEEIERQFNVSINATGIENRFYTGSFSNQKLSEVLETVCLPMNLDYEIKGQNKVTIKPKDN